MSDYWQYLDESRWQRHLFENAEVDTNQDPVLDSIAGDKNQQQEYTSTSANISTTSAGSNCSEKEQPSHGIVYPCPKWGSTWREPGQSVVDYWTDKVTIKRNYLFPAVKRAIVTIDGDKVEPDVARGTSLHAVKSDRQMSNRRSGGIAINLKTEKIYLTDRQLHAVLVFEPDGELLHKYGGPGTEPGFFSRPTGIAYDAVHERLLVVDTDNHRVQGLDVNSGKCVVSFGSRGSKSGQFFFPWGIAVSPDGQHIVVADASNRRVQLFSLDGEFINEIADMLNYPRGIVFDKSGKFLYVTDYNEHCVFRLDVQEFTELVPVVDDVVLNRPSGIDVDEAGNILVCDTGNNAIKAFQADGEVIGGIESVGGLPLVYPVDIKVGRAGFITVLDNNARVRTM